jgi:hypothetical protein
MSLPARMAAANPASIGRSGFLPIPRKAGWFRPLHVKEVSNRHSGQVRNPARPLFEEEIIRFKEPGEHSL